MYDTGMEKRSNEEERVRKHILGLKLKMSSATELDEIGTYFFDHLGESRAFMDIGSPVRNEMLEQLMAQIYQTVIGEETVMLHDLLLISLPQYNFIHGPCMINQHMANILYFEDLDAGLMMLTKFPPGTGNRTEFARFSIQNLTDKSPYQNN